VGGSGFYIQALVNGMFEETPIKIEVKAQVKTLLTELGPRGLYEHLCEKDSGYAATIHENDTYRVGRALELILSLNKSMQQINTEFSKAQTKLPYPHLFMGVKVEREKLRERVSLRLEQMLSLGFRKEVEALIDEGLSLWKPMASVGYKEMLGLIAEQFNEEHFKTEVIKNTMRLAKRQMTWFKRNKDIHWFDPAIKEELDLAVKNCKDFLLSELK